MQRKVRGSSLIMSTLITAFLLTGLAVKVAKTQQSVFAATNSNGIVVQAQQHGETQASVLRMTKYSDLKSQSKTKINDTDFSYEVVVSGETNYNDKIKQRIATVKIYYQNEVNPRFTLPIAMHI